MTIIYIANARIPTEKAHGIQIMKMCSAFGDRYPGGVELVLPKRANLIKQGPFEYYGVEINFRIRKLPCLDLIPLDKYIGHLGLWIEGATFLFSAIFYVLSKKADIIYIRDRFLLPISLFKKNVIFEAHTFPKRYSLYFPFWTRLKGLVVITQGLKNLFSQNGVNPERIAVAPDGVDLNKFIIEQTKSGARSILNLPQDEKIALYTGHLYGWKGADVLLEAARRCPDILFVFVGGTKEDIDNFKVKSSNVRNVRIIGHRPYAEIPYWLKAADVLVLPNSAKQEISRRWTSPLKLFEYMASGNPIIASDLPSIREILNEDNAILAEPDNPQGLAESIKKALQNQQLSDRISFKALRDVREYSWEKRVKNICQKLF